MKTCRHCDREVMSDAKFCPFCGASLADVAVNITPQPVNNIPSYEAPPLPDTNIETQNFHNVNTTPLPPNKGLVWLILSSVLTFLGCCTGVGLLQIVTIVVSAISISRYNKGDYEGSDRLAKTSMILFFSLLAFVVLAIILFFVFTGGMINFNYEFPSKIY